MITDQVYSMFEYCDICGCKTTQVMTCSYDPDNKLKGYSTLNPDLMFAYPNTIKYKCETCGEVRIHNNDS